MGKDWCDCIVTLIDVIGTKKAENPTKLMRDLHALLAKPNSKPASIDHVYAWNDSVLLLSFLNRMTYAEAMGGAERVKRRIDCEVAPSYAIAVKGQAFPQIDATAGAEQNPGVTVIRASSWAMANCFKIEQQAKIGRWGYWYVDSRIAREIQTNQRSIKKIEVKMLGARGRTQARLIHAFSGYLWNDNAQKRTRTVKS